MTSQLHMQVSGLGTYSNPGFGGKSYLLQESSKHFIQMMDIARDDHEDEEVKSFYSHVSSHCLRIRDYVERSRQNLDSAIGELVNDAVKHLGSFITESGLQDLQGHITTTEYRLKALNLDWNEIQRHNNNTKATFVRRRLKLDMPSEQRTELDNALRVCADALDKTTYKYSYRGPKDTRTAPSIIERSETVLKAAQSAFDALFNNTSCSCTDTHELKAKLELNTYKIPEELARSQSTVGSAKQKRNTFENDELVGELQFDMFLSMKDDWQELRVCSVKERIVRFALSGEELSRSRTNSTRRSKKVESLCKTVAKVKSKALRRLVLRLTGGELFELPSEKSSFWIDNLAQPISLSRCLEERRDFFTEKMKPSTTPHGLSQAGVLRALNSSKTPRAGLPYDLSYNRICPSDGGLNLQLVLNDSNSDDDDSLDLNSNHRCPELIALAVVLIELHFIKPFRKLADTHRIPLTEGPHGRIYLVDVDQVLDGDVKEKLEGWRPQIPQDTPLLDAIDNCLKTSLWEDHAGEPLDSTTLTSRIYQHVVRLLEDNLTRAFNDIPLDGIDEYARDMDLGNWGQSIALGPNQDANPVGPAVLTPTNRVPLSLSPYADAKENFVARRMRESENQIHHRSSSSSPFPVTFGDTSSSGAQPETCQFFDDMASERDSDTQSRKYRSWKSEFANVYEKFVKGRTANDSCNAVKVAILDTGIDGDHEFIEAQKKNLKERHNCHNESQKTVADRNGHGTFAASLILEYAPDVELYVIKIADKNAIPDPKVVAKAIDYALDKWNVDIISMSFGWPSSRFHGSDDIQAAIDRAYGSKVLMFAAAANSGGRRGRAYPASSTHVICVHSTDTDGNRSSFSPTAYSDAINLATVGESVESAWPTLLCHEGEYLKTRSGTSYATPILVGISAFLLQFARLHLSQSEAMLLKRKDRMEALLRRCAERGPNYQPRDGYFYVELSLDRHNLFGQDLESVCGDITRILSM